MISFKKKQTSGGNDFFEKETNWRGFAPQDYYFFISEGGVKKEIIVVRLRLSPIISSGASLRLCYWRDQTPFGGFGLALIIVKRIFDPPSKLMAHLRCASPSLSEDLRSSSREREGLRSEAPLCFFCVAGRRPLRGSSSRYLV